MQTGAGPTGAGPTGAGPTGAGPTRDGLQGPDALLGVGRAALDLPGAAGVEVAVTRSDSAVTRFAGSRVHQSSTRADLEVRVRVVVDGGRVGVARTSSGARDHVRAAAERALASARLLPADPDFPGLAPPATYRPAPPYDEETASAPAGRRAELVAQVLAQLPDGVTGAGTVSTGVVEKGLLSTTGLSAYGVTTSAGATVLAGGGTSSGWAEGGGTAVGALDCAALGRRAAEKVRLGAHPREVPAGRYPVVLEPGATSVLVQWLGWLAFGGKAVQEERSALTGRLGERVCSPLVTVVDDPLSPLLPGLPFDEEGTPTRRTVLLDTGLAAAVAHDRATAARSGTASTGHALPPPNPQGGIPRHLVLEPGSASLDDLVAGLERGLYVTRFHYTNVLHPVRTLLTGMTRDGTFLVENGRIVGGVRDLRFRQSALDALAGVQAVGRDLEVSSDLFYGASAAPAVRLADFAFPASS